MKNTKLIAEKLRVFLRSKTFLYVIIGILVIESIWVAVSFRYPMIYDEGTHMAFIQMYSDTFIPYTNETPANMTTQISLFHYVMSFPYRVLSQYMGFNLIVILFRMICIALVAWGIWLYSKVLREMRIPNSSVNLGLLLFVLLPITPFVAATVNYDNLLFPLTALFMLYSVRVLNDKKINILNVSLLLTTGFTAALVKYSFLPIFAAALVFIVIWLVYKHKQSTWPQFRSSFKKLSARQKQVYGTGMIVVMIPFLLVFGLNAIRYQSVKPSCFEVQPEQKCLANGIIQRTIKARETKDERMVTPPTNFIYATWFNNMLKTTNWSGNRTVNNNFAFAQPLPVMDTLLFTGIILGMASLLLMWRSLPLTVAAKFGVYMFTILLLTILLINLKGYYNLHAAYANQPRYLLSLLPILLALIIWSVSSLIGNRSNAKIGILVISLLLFTQGGGSITHILRSDNTWYWQNSELIAVNEGLRKVMQKVVIESYGW